MQRRFLFGLLAAVLFFAAALNLSAQGTAISYQGQLGVSGVPANTNYDFRFTVYGAPTNGTAVSLSLTNLAVPVSNGLFSVILNFGPGVFNGTLNGSNDWLDIGVRAIGVTNFTALWPRQPILPVPYALFATSASNLLGSLQSTQILGRISSALISGSYSNGVVFLNGTNSFTGTFTGNGIGVTNLNASNLASGTVPDALLPLDVALLGQNQVFTGSNSFTGPGTYTGVNTFNNDANSFTGNFYGNGLVGWGPVSGLTTNATRDHGYLMLSPGLSTVLLPASGTLTAGDIVRVSGGGTGGWMVLKNSSQSIVGNFAAYKNSSLALLTGPAGSDDCSGIAGSADGLRKFLVGNGIIGVEASSDGGITWNLVGGTGLSTTASWYSVACSANGQIVYAEPYTGGTIMESTNSGSTWSTSSYSATNVALACTADGSQLFLNNYACSGNGTYLAKVSGGAIAITTNSGGYWFTIPHVANVTFNCVAASADCTRVVAGVNNGLLYATSNLGTNWTTLSVSNQYWSAVWMSPDGSKLAGTVSKNGVIGGGVYSGNVSAVPGTASTIGGSQGSAVELQFIGGNQFIPVSSSGLLWAN